MAHVRGGLSVLDYVRIIACQEVSREGIRGIAPPAIVLAEAEGLRGHAESLRVRCANA
jgi:histidinol dehydrogenase